MHGDIWHGCGFCTDHNDFNPITGVSYGLLYKNTITKRDLILSKGYKYVCIWECEWRQFMAESGGYKALMAQPQLIQDVSEFVSTHGTGLARPWLQLASVLDQAGDVDDALDLLHYYMYMDALAAAAPQPDVIEMSLEDLID
jgi:hypothetical protein